MDRTIGELPSASAINDASLIPIEQSGDAMSVTGALVKSYAQGAITGLTATATTLAAGSQATVTKAVQDGTLRLTFGIPKGDTGATGPSGSGTGDMVASVYDPAGGARQVAFADEITQGMESFTRPNLLDNWYFVGGGSQLGGGKFPVNQRGETSYSGHNTMSVDRWVMRQSSTSSTSVTLSSDGLVFSGSGVGIASGGLTGMNQTLENKEMYAGQTVTISALVKNVTVSASDQLSLRLTSANGRTLHSYNHGSVYINGDGLFSRTLTVNAANVATYTNLNFGFMLNTNQSASMTIVAVKMELGDTQTLAHQVNGEWVLNELPNYQEQLSRCQRHLYVMNTAGVSPAYIGCGMATQTNFAYILTTFPVTMRDIPTVTLSGSINLRSGSTARTVTSVTMGSGSTDNAQLTLGSTNMTAGEAQMAYLSGSTSRLIFSAEI